MAPVTKVRKYRFEETDLTEVLLRFFIPMSLPGRAILFVA